MLVSLHSATILQQSNKMSGEVLYSSVKFTRKPGDQAAAKLCAGREDDVTYATVKFAEAPSSQQQQQTDPSRTAERVCKACPVNWVESNGKCYYFSTDTMDWNSSRASCVSMGADLVIIESEAEQRFLLDKAKA
ncbi:CD209 antigen-like protein A [Acipenser ruthenus]|uniref:CD209 antigen-like protein A n=1 Tax=Acipenser ruthenus TaxID=7906 RepID=UPI00274105D3|nr:CD209 antigen-like protein A [Acipenser ruthenus]